MNSISPQPYRAIFWDFDGVIKESVHIKIEGFQRLFEPYGKEIMAKVMAHHRQHGGISRLVKIPQYFLEFIGREATKEEVAEYCLRYSQFVLQKVVETEWVPGVESFLRNNPFQQYFFLVTGTPQEEIEVILRELALTSCFEKIFGAPWQKEKALATMIQQYELVLGDCLMVGDSLTDYQAALENQIPFLLRATEENQEYFANYQGYRVEDFLSWKTA